MAPKCVVFNMLWGLVFAYSVPFSQPSPARAEDWGIHEGTLEVSTNKKPKAVQVDFLIVNSPTAILYAYHPGSLSVDGKLKVRYEFFHEPKPFRVHFWGV